MASMRQPLFMFQLSSSPHLVTHNFTHCQTQIEHHSSQCKDGVWQFSVWHWKRSSNTSLFSCTFTLLLTDWKKEKKAEELPVLLQDYKNQTGAENIFCAQVLSPSPGLKHLLTETENKAPLSPDCAKKRSVQYLWYF